MARPPAQHSQPRTWPGTGSSLLLGTAGRAWAARWRSHTDVCTAAHVHCVGAPAGGAAMLFVTGTSHGWWNFPHRIVCSAAIPSWPLPHSSRNSMPLCRSRGPQIMGTLTLLYSCSFSAICFLLSNVLQGHCMGASQAQPLGSAPFYSCSRRAACSAWAGALVLQPVWVQVSRSFFCKSLSEAMSSCMWCPLRAAGMVGIRARPWPTAVFVPLPCCGMALHWDPVCKRHLQEALSRLA